MLADRWWCCSTCRSCSSCIVRSIRICSCIIISSEMNDDDAVLVPRSTSSRSSFTGMVLLPAVVVVSAQVLLVKIDD